MAEINVTPFVDVMLVLLIVFMVTAPLLTAGVPVDLPESRAAALPQETQEVQVTLATDGQVYLDNDPVALGALPQRLEAIAAQSGGELPTITLRADRLISYGEVMGVMGELNRAGFNAISLVTESGAPRPIPAEAAQTAETGVSDGSGGGA